jgi:rSAM/selenodomain-associated transferase 2
LGLTVECLPPLRDVDTRADLEVWERASRRTISAVIPTLDEERDLPRALGSLQASPGVELVVADGGSRDATLEVAGRAGARLVHSAPGRARQLNAGAGAASGDILLFLHADTSLPAGFDSLVRDSFADPAVVGGSFALSFDPCPPLLKVNEITANWRARFLHLPFGDQALFVKASIFRLLGGFREMPLLEDVDFVRRLSRAGKLAFLGRPVRTSSRRYGREIFRTTLKNKAVFLGYFLGVRPERLARLYGRRQRDG